jgi:adenine-specific DNA-methyltransferase
MIKKCQVFTPLKNVIELLDAVGYTTDLFGKKVIENDCGDGNILLEIVKRYIENSLDANRDLTDIKFGLEQDIFGSEIDENHYIKCLDNLDRVAKKYGIDNVKWNILNKDILRENLPAKFDFVIGNPPYINYRDLDEQTRGYLKKTFLTCAHGKFDYCYAFVEASLGCLNETGKLSYLIPSSIFKNVFAQELRNLVLPFTTKILDYTTQRLFENVLTSSAILVCDKKSVQDYIEYYDVVNNNILKLKKNDLKNKWFFSSERRMNISKKRFGDYFNASISIATLLNKAYVLKEYTEEEGYIIVDNYRIERSVVREGVSPKSINYNKKELLVFPYRYQDNSLVRYKSEEFEKQFAGAASYLKSFLEELKERKADKNVEWFEYGRTQALAHLNQPKLLLSTVVTKEVKVYNLSKDCIPYSGIYVIPKGELPLSRAKEILESDDFYKYVQSIGINANGSSMRITAADINNYEF